MRGPEALCTYQYLLPVRWSHQGSFPPRARVSSNWPPPPPTHWVRRKTTGVTSMNQKEVNGDV